MKKTNYNKGTFTILTTFDEGFEYADYVDCCECKGINPKGADSPEFFEWCKKEAWDNYEADLDNIKYCKEYKVPVIITGTLGLWDGRHDITAVICPSVYDAIMKICSGDIHDVEAKFIDGRIEVNAYHHDGCNCFTINALSAQGKKKAGYEYHNTLLEDAKPRDTKRLPYLYAI